MKNNSCKNDSYKILSNLKSRIENLSRDNYKFVLKFMNEIMEEEITSLLEIKDYDIDKINKSNYEKVIKKYEEKISSEFCEEFTCNFDELPDLMKEILSKIGYVLLVTEIINKRTNKKKIIITIKYKEKTFNSANDYLSSFRNEEILKIKRKKKVFLEFLQNLTTKKISSLTEFKKIDINKIDIDDFEMIVYDHKEKLEDVLDIEIDNTLDIYEILQKCTQAVGLSINKERVKKDNCVKVFVSISR